jgi:hypothetical protein
MKDRSRDAPLVWSGTKKEFDKRRYQIVDKYDVVAFTDWHRSIVKKGTWPKGGVKVDDLRRAVIILEEDE